MAGDTIWQDLQEFQIETKRTKHRLNKFIEDCESFEQWKEFASKEFENIRELYKKALIDDKEKAEIFYDEVLEIYLEACDNAPKEIAVECMC